MDKQRFEDNSNPMEVSFDHADNEDKPQNVKSVEISFDGEDEVKTNLVVDLVHDTDDDEFLQMMECSTQILRLSKAENKIEKIV